MEIWRWPARTNIGLTVRSGGVCSATWKTTTARSPSPLEAGFFDFAPSAETHQNAQEAPMAKPVVQKIKLLSTAGTGFFYVTKKNPRNTTEKMVFKKYDPVVRKHVEFKEHKIK